MREILLLPCKDTLSDGFFMLAFFSLQSLQEPGPLKKGGGSPPPVM